MQPGNPPRQKCRFTKLKVKMATFVCTESECSSGVTLYLSVDRAVSSHITVTPHDDVSLLVQWKSVDQPGLTGYVVEWRPLLKTDLSLIQFEKADRNQSSLLITGMVHIAGVKVLALLYLFRLYFVFLIWFSSFTTRIQTITLVHDLFSPVHDPPYTLLRAHGP